MAFAWDSSAISSISDTGVSGNSIPLYGSEFQEYEDPSFDSVSPVHGLLFII
jgi:hypothetical protein